MIHVIFLSYRYHVGTSQNVYTNQVQEYLIQTMMHIYYRNVFFFVVVDKEDYRNVTLMSLHTETYSCYIIEDRKIATFWNKVLVWSDTTINVGQDPLLLLHGK